MWPITGLRESFTTPHWRGRMQITNERIEQMAGNIELEEFDPIDRGSENNYPGNLAKSF
jgi:hypothetical protein